MLKKKANEEEKKPLAQEIQELQRKFRVLENDKRAYSEDSQGIIRKQRATIEKLTRENRKMKQDLNETRAMAAGRAEHKIGAEKLQRIQENKDAIEVQMQETLQKQAQLNQQIETLQKKVWQTREQLGRQGGVMSSKENSDAIQKQIQILENRLDKALQKFNDAVAYNKMQRDTIDGLRRERVVFDNIYKKLENELQQKKKEMANIIEQANAAYEARDQAQQQMAALKQQADKEHQEFEREWKELGRLIENDKKMKEFMRQRERARITDDDKQGDLTLTEEAKLKKKVTASAWGMAKDKAAIHSSMEKVSSYEEAFAKIQAATGICSIDELVETFINAEDQNFSYFNFANSQSGDIEKIQASIEELRAEYETLKDSKPGQSTANKQRLLQDLEDRFNKTDKAAEAYELKYTTALKTLTAVRAGMQSVFNRLGCSPAEISSLQSHQGVTEENIMAYMSVIEGRTSEILQIHATMNQADDDDEAPPPARHVPSAQLTIRYPSTVEDFSDDDEDEDEDDTRPYTREELKLKCARGIQKKQDKRGKARRN
mmetsp:Transcript_40574/g.85821  ORF Transcript_40574/g.85821 Transcript_40574/m.85821 type:complete len:546 (-) Transcript_40574:85-1722(-)